MISPILRESFYHHLISKLLEITFLLVLCIDSNRLLGSLLIQVDKSVKKNLHANNCFRLEADTLSQTVFVHPSLALEYEIKEVKIKRKIFSSYISPLSLIHLRWRRKASNVLLASEIEYYCQLVLVIHLLKHNQVKQNGEGKILS